ncbi:Fic family protein [Edaphobacter bradus]|uniref:Fic family protein n=1 Tax=Edaphobacter bradus TaxID=2259016 RepID=UPI0021DFAA90|nr:Fic family protein [Edaphobacter bradus]
MPTNLLWNWQKGDWQEFTWDRSRMAPAEERFLVSAGILIGTVRHLGEEQQDQLRVETMSGEAVTTSEIEGEILNRASVQSSIQRQLGLKDERRSATAAEQGIAEMMVDLCRSFSEPLSGKTLFRWHRMMAGGRKDLSEIGRYRLSPEPMQIVSGVAGAPRVHFEAPPSKQVPSEMRRFLAWFNRTSPRGDRSLPALTRAGLAHLYFESIHPFQDGNGRIGRAISEKAIGESFGQPVLIALAATILAHRKGYYDALEQANKSNETTDWLAWFAEIAVEAQQRTIAQVEFLIEKTKLLDRLRDQINARQQKALLRMLREGPDGFKGGLSASNYSTITGASTATTTRDLVDLVNKGALVRIGELKHARYELNLPKRS